MTMTVRNMRRGEARRSIYLTLIEEGRKEGRVFSLIVLDVSFLIRLSLR